MVKIEKGIKFPESRRSKYPWKEMKVGDSFAAIGGSSSWTLAWLASKRYAPKVFKGAVLDGVDRVWRIA